MKTFKFNADIWVHADSKDEALSHLYEECDWLFGLYNGLLAIQSNEGHEIKEIKEDV